VGIENALRWLQNLPFPTNIRESSWLFPTIETIHVFALVLVVGSILTVDLRLLGFANRDRPFSHIAEEMLPLTWTAFAVAVTAGLLMFSSKALIYYNDVPFRIKMTCLVLAGLNMLGFHRIGARHVTKWDAGNPPAAARLAGAASVLLWAIIVGAGRWIGFTT